MDAGQYAVNSVVNGVQHVTTRVVDGVQHVGNRFVDGVQHVLTGHHGQHRRGYYTHLSQQYGQVDSDKKSSKLSTGAIIGIVAGGVCLVGVCIAAACFFMRSQKPGNVDDMEMNDMGN